MIAGHRVLLRRGPDAPQVPAERVSELLGARDPRTQLLPVGQDGFLAARSRGALGRRGPDGA
ncbi:hypothetical protein ACRAWF_11350 [Streptomyces sp. L7]